MEEINKYLSILQTYRQGKQQLQSRILSAENWWRLRNLDEAQKEGIHKKEDFTSRSGWLHNVIVSKHADAMDAYPMANILPREASDVAQATVLSQVIPCILEQNRFDSVYSDVMWQKLKTGTGVYKVFWDENAHFGLGDIGICRCNLLDLYWEPQVADIQKSKYLFHLEAWDKDALEEAFPHVQGKLKTGGLLQPTFPGDGPVARDKITVVDMYYREKGVVQFKKFVEGHMLYETGPEGLYDHGKYPYVFDTLFPVEGSPCGYGFVDLCRNPQMQIDILKTAFVKNARAGAVPRYFSRLDGNVNEEQFLDADQPLVKVAGNVDEATLRRIEHCSLDGNYLHLLDQTIDELRQTSGNQEAATGAAPGGVTAASAIAALQEAAGKGSRDATNASYRAYAQVVELCVELIRQFYTLPRQFRITGEFGQAAFVSFDNTGLLPRAQNAFGVEMGLRSPLFDIKIIPQRNSAYTRLSQNELALQFFKLGFFQPENYPQAIKCLQMMDFDGREKMLNILSAAGGR